MSKFGQLGLATLHPGSATEVETFDTPSLAQVRDTALHRAVGEYVVEQCSADIDEYLEIHLPEHGLAVMERELETLTDGLSERLYGKILSGLGSYPAKNRKQVNRELVSVEQIAIELFIGMRKPSPSPVNVFYVLVFGYR